MSDVGEELGIAGGRLPRSAELLAVARRMVWWQSPEETLEDPALFLAQVMTYGTWNDVEQVRQGCGEEPLREILTRPPPGIFDAPSWYYWHRRFGLEPVPPLPKRRFP